TMRITVAKALLLVVAMIAAYVTSLKPGNILFLVGAAFSMAASAFFPALVMGIFWKRATKWGAITGILAGLGVCLYYMVHTYPTFIQWFGTTPMQKWWGLDPISAGMFGVPVGIITIFVVSLVTPAPDQEVQELVDHVRYPNLEGDIDTRGT
ncbi:MAG: cation acetate symporter, partial [Burkholderiales bacterium]|nr:cation acetate symporter [Burkholderiales bacterium]